MMQLWRSNLKGKDFSKTYEENILKCRNIYRRLHSVAGDDPGLNKTKKYIKNINKLLIKCLSHQNDINDLIEKLKINFLKINQQLDYNMKVI